MGADVRGVVGRLSGPVSWGLWATCMAAAAFATLRQEGMVAVGPERWLGPLLLAGVHVPVALLLEVQRRLIVRLVPIWATAVAVVPPLLTLVLVWGPGLDARVALPAEVPAPAVAGPSVVLLTLDSFRADQVGAMAGGTLTPNIDALAASGLLYTQAITTAPLSGPAHATMLTGMGPLEHGLTSNGAAVKVGTVVDAIRERGYRTGAFVSAQVLDRDSGLHIGFTHYDDRWGIVQRLRWLPAFAQLEPAGEPPRRSGAQTVDRALEWFEASPSPSFLWIHLYDAHGPYNPPPEFQPPAAALDEARRMDREDLRRRSTIDMLGDRTRSRVREQTLEYTYSVRWVDALVGRVVKQLPPDTIVIVAGDHGESLGEHDYFFNHGSELWEQALDVPLVVRWPGRFEPGTRFDGLTSLVAVNRLLRQATGLDPLVAPAAEASVFAYTTGQEGRRVIEEGEELLRGGKRSPAAGCVRRDGSKVLARAGEPAAYYDLNADPEETTALPVPPELANDAALLEQVLSRPAPRLDDEQRARLEALGYRE